jgi:hypothetical protein
MSCHRARFRPRLALRGTAANGHHSQGAVVQRIRDGRSLATLARRTRCEQNTSKSLPRSNIHLVQGGALVNLAFAFFHGWPQSAKVFEALMRSKLILADPMQRASRRSERKPALATGLSGQ